jgi:hypothetical protein
MAPHNILHAGLNLFVHFGTIVLIAFCVYVLRKCWAHYDPQQPANRSFRSTTTAGYRPVLSDESRDIPMNINSSGRA